MGFYLRKSFRAGPLRINLSKGGLGFSLGVTGARVGVTSRGRGYIHAGRGGLYVREYLGSKTAAQQERLDSGMQSDPTTLYEDTGVTFVVEGIPSADLVPLQERLTRKRLRVAVYLLLPLVAAVIAAVIANHATMGPTWTIALGLVSLALLILWPIPMVRAAIRNRRGSKLGETLQTRLLAGRPLTPTDVGRLRQAIQDPKVSQTDREYQCKSAYLQLLLAMVVDRSVSEDELALLKTVEELCNLTPVFRAEARVDVFRQVYLESVADRDLTVQEEAGVDQIRIALGIAEEAVSNEVALVRQLGEIRSTRSGHLAAIASTTPLQNGEICYYEGVARVLKFKTLRSFQRDRRKYSVRGLAIEREGTLLVTNKRLLVIQEGTTAIPFSKILEFEIDHDRNLIAITKDGANAPVYLTTPDALRVSAILASASGH